MNRSNKLDALLISDLNRLNYKLEKIIYYNHGKRRYTLLVSVKQNTYILKWNHPSESIHANKLATEVDFYMNYTNNGISPLLHYHENHILVIEYIESITLREWLISYVSQLEGDVITEGFKSCICKLTNTLSEFYVVGIKKHEITSLTNILLTRFKFLTLGVPMSLPRNRIENFLLRLNWLVSRRILGKTIYKLLFHHENKGIFSFFRIHADLHLNNIIVSLNGENIKIIDWENNKDGSIFEDVNYLSAFLYHLLIGYPNHQQYLSKQFEGLMNKIDNNSCLFYKELNKLYVLAISVNRSFGYNIPLKNFIVSLIKYQIEISKFHFKRTSQVIDPR